MMTGVLSVVISVVISTNAVLSVSVYQHSGQKNRTREVTYGTNQLDQNTGRHG